MASRSHYCHSCWSFTTPKECSLGLLHSQRNCFFLTNPMAKVSLHLNSEVSLTLLIFGFSLTPIDSSFLISSESPSCPVGVLQLSIEGLFFQSYSLEYPVLKLVTTLLRYNWNHYLSTFLANIQSLSHPLPLFHYHCPSLFQVSDISY